MSFNFVFAIRRWSLLFSGEISSKEDKRVADTPVWTDATITDQINHRPTSPLCYPAFCYETRKIFILSKSNCLTCYSINPESLSFSKEKQQKLEFKVSSLAIGPDETIYVSYDIGGTPNIHQYHCGRKFLQSIGKISMKSPSKNYFNVKYLLCSIPKKSVLLVLPVTLHSAIEVAYIFLDNVPMRQVVLPCNTLHALFFEFSAKTGLLADFGRFTRSVIYRFDWADLIDDECQDVFHEFADIDGIECRCITSFKTPGSSRQSVALGIIKSNQLFSHNYRKMVINTFETKTKNATAELIGRSEVRIQRGFQPLYFLSIKEGLVIGRSTDLDDFILLMKLS